MRTPLLVLALALPLPAAAAAQQPTAPAVQLPQIVATGDGEAQVAPDRAYLDVAVETSAATAVEAAAENARLMATVREAIRRAGVPDAAVSGGGYYVAANTTYDGGRQRQEGYRAANSLRVEMERFERMGAVVDAALAAGANRIADVRYTVRDPGPARRQAIEAAVARARTDAEAMARAAGGTLGPLLEITNVRSELPGMYSMASARAVGGETSISPREIVVRAVVNTRWTFVPR